MGIDNEQYRVCVGLFNSHVCPTKSRSQASTDCSCGSMKMCDECNNFYRLLIQSVGFVIYSYLILYILLLMCDLVARRKLQNRLPLNFYPTTTQALYFSNRSYLNLQFLIVFLSSTFIRFCELRTSAGCKYLTKMLKCCVKNFTKKHTGKTGRLILWTLFIDLFSFFLCGLNLSLIIICNTSILNPGPNVNRPLSVFYNNVQGLINYRDLASNSPPLNTTKLHELHGYLYIHKPDVVILNETWLKKSILDNEVLPNSYNILRVDRTINSHPFDHDQPKKFRKNGGGVLIAHRTDINVTSSKINLVSAQAEVLSVILKLPNDKRVCISTVYRVGTLGIPNLNELKKHFETIARKKKLDKHILIGDFNLSSVDWPESTTSCDLQRRFLDFFLGDLGHVQLISEATHKSGRALDLLFTNVPQLVENVSVLDQNEACLSDHHAITFNVKLQCYPKKCHKPKVYDYSKANWRGLEFDLRQANLTNKIGPLDPHVAWPLFKSELTKLCDKHIPKRKVKDHFQPPWFDQECEAIYKQKERWRKKAKSGPNRESHLEKFRHLRRKLKKVMNEKMRLNVEDDSDPALISKKFWSHVKSKSKSSRIPETVYYGNRFRRDCTDQAALFNDYFSHQFSDPSDYDVNIEYDHNCRFKDLRFHVLDVFLILKSTNSSKAAGPDGMHGLLLKNAASSLAKPLTMLFNRSYASGHIPDEWKLASVVPVHKKGDKGSVENYRPISLTCLFMKVFERCIKTKLLAECEQHLDSRQHGFMNGKSCTTQMVPFTDNLALALNNKSRVDIIYFDFAKAFDTVSHDLILHKLKYLYGVDGLMLRFIRSYLQGRQQQVVVGGSKSSTLPVHSGVPQGSILGPLLFVLFINDMFSSVSENSDIALYADDTKIWREITCFNDHSILQRDIDNLLKWSIENKMKFHPSKCKALSVTMQRNILDNLPFNIYHYMLGDTYIDYVPSQKDLGVLVNSKLLWGPQIDSLISSASSKLGLLRRTCHFTTNKRQKRSFYLAIVRSLFEHCSVIWGPQHASHIAKFDMIQKRATKWIDGHPFAHYSEEEFLNKQREHNLLPMKMRFRFNDLKLFYQILNGLVPIELPNYITPVEVSQARYTRRTAAVIEGSDTTSLSCSIVPTIDTFRNSYFYRTMRLWNSLPVSVRQTSCISSFKHDLLKLLWSPDTVWPD